MVAGRPRIWRFLLGFLVITPTLGAALSLTWILAGVPLPDHPPARLLVQAPFMLWGLGLLGGGLPALVTMGLLRQFWTAQRSRWAYVGQAAAIGFAATLGFDLVFAIVVSLPAIRHAADALQLFGGLAVAGAIAAAAGSLTTLPSGRPA